MKRLKVSRIDRSKEHRILSTDAEIVSEIVVELASELVLELGIEFGLWLDSPPAAADIGVAAAVADVAVDDTVVDLAVAFQLFQPLELSELSRSQQHPIPFHRLAPSDLELL